MSIHKKGTQSTPNDLFVRHPTIISSPRAHALIDPCALTEQLIIHLLGALETSSCKVRPSQIRPCYNEMLD